MRMLRTDYTGDKDNERTTEQRFESRRVTRYATPNMLQIHHARYTADTPRQIRHNEDLPRRFLCETIGELFQNEGRGMIRYLCLLFLFLSPWSVVVSILVTVLPVGPLFSLFYYLKLLHIICDLLLVISSLVPTYIMVPLNFHLSVLL